MPEFYRTGDTYVWKGEPYERFPAKEAGFRYNGVDKVWTTKYVEKAIRLIDYAGPELRKELEEIRDGLQKNFAGSHATDADLDIPVPHGLKEFGFQRGGVAFGHGKPAVFYGDEMGLGKTIQALLLINLDPTIKRVLVICPAAVRLNWLKEARKWLTREFNFGMALGKVWPDGADFVVINYDILAKHYDALRAEEWDMLICDEIHYLKNQKAKRTQQVFGKRDGRKKQNAGWQFTPIPARKKVALTGTPILNRPIELWPIISWLDPMTWKSFWFFAKRYCAAYQGRWGWDLTGASNLDELHNKLRTTILVRRLKKDVLTDLPPKIRQVIELPANGEAARLVEAEKAKFAENAPDFEEATRIAEEVWEDAQRTGDMDAYEAAIRSLRKGSKYAFEEIAAIRHQIALAKVPSVIEHAEDLLEDGGKLVIFAHHRDVLKKLKEHFGDKAVLLWGGLNPQQQQKAVDDFQENDDVTVFLGQTKAAGQGITLTASSRVLFAELDWVPGLITQAEDRCHRIGQRDSVMVQHIVFEASLDVQMAETLIEKQRVADQALDNTEAAKKLQAINMPIQKPKLTPAKQRIFDLGQVMTEDDKADVHLAIQMVAGVCDGAWAQDGRGFNKFDSHIGKDMAARGTLTTGQAAFGLSLVYKYKGQLPGYMVNKLDNIWERYRARKEEK